MYTDEDLENARQEGFDSGYDEGYYNGYDEAANDCDCNDELEELKDSIRYEIDRL